MNIFIFYFYKKYVAVKHGSALSKYDQLFFANKFIFHKIIYQHPSIYARQTEELDSTDLLNNPTTTFRLAPSTIIFVRPMELS